MIQKKVYAITLIFFMLLSILFGGVYFNYVTAAPAGDEMDPIDGIETGDWERECGQVPCCGGDFGGIKVEGWSDGNDGTFDNEHGSVTISNSDGYSFEFDSTKPVACVLVKAGQQYFVYCYDPYVTSGSLYIVFDNEISHTTFCFGEGEEELIVTKDVVTYYDRQHYWEIDKSVTTENGHLLDGIPKIWLYPDGSGDECATWSVDVTHEGYEDIDHNVSGTITIENTGEIAAEITEVRDFLGGSEITPEFDVSFPYTLEVGETLIGSYDEDGYYEGSNEVTVSTTIRDYYGDADIIWDVPNNEYDDTININDVSDLFGEVALGELTAPNGNTFTYEECFFWSDYTAPGPYIYNNTATIAQTGQSAEAVLKINWLDEELTVTKEVNTSYNLTHLWDIAKRVETENGHLLDGIPKIWLYPDGSGDECAEWFVDVTYLGTQESDYNVSGTVTIENTGEVDAVITGVTDLLGGTDINVNFDVSFPYTLEIGDTLVGTFNEDGYFEGINEATVTTSIRSYSGSETINWGDPDMVYNETANIVDVSDLFGEVTLGTVTAPTGNTFTYDKCFFWTDYSEPGPYIYDNTATIEQTGQSAEAVLKINWLDEELTVTKDVVTYYERDYLWDIAKRVETENGYLLDGVPKIWLFIDGSGDESAEWIVDVSYEGYEDTAQNVSGTVTIENTGDLDAEITGVTDLLGGTDITVNFDVSFPYTLAVGDTLVGTYNEAGYFEGNNEVTVTTQIRDYYGSAEIIWGDPNKSNNETVNIKDNSILFGEVKLGTLTAPNGGSFSYSKEFAWADYGENECGSLQYNNLATIEETQQSDNALLKVNIQCYIDETAFAMGDNAECFLNHSFKRWGWTNPITYGEYSWPIYAGAAQCDTSKGEFVGYAHVDYSENDLDIVIELEQGYTLLEKHYYAGENEFPFLKNGKETVSPGNYYIEDDLSGEIYVIIHTVVGIPDPDFGP